MRTVTSTLRRQTRVSVVRTRRGNVNRIVREHYLRNDIVCGVAACDECAAASSATSARRLDSAVDVLLPDADVLLHQIDWLEQSAVRNVLLLQTQLDVVRCASTHTHARLRALVNDDAKRFVVFSNAHHVDTALEPAAHETDAAFAARSFRTAARWFALHWRPLQIVPCVLVHRAAALAPLTADDVAAAFTVQQYVATRFADSHPELLDTIVAEAHDDDDDDDAGAPGGSRSARGSYPAHLLLADIEEGLRSGEFVQGKLHMNRNNHLEGCVVPHDSSKSALLSGAMPADAAAAAAAGRMDSDDFVVAGVMIQGAAALNRATEGDIVAVRVLPRSQWRAESHLLLATPDVESARDTSEVGALEAASGAAAAAAGGGDSGADAADVAEALPPLLDDAAGALSAVTGSATGGQLRATGEVVGVLRRAWRPLCGAVLPALDRNQAGSVQSAIFVPADRRMPHVRIRSRQVASLVGQRVVVALDSWPRTSRYPLGHYVRSIGAIGDAESETEALLLQYEIPHHPFSPAVLECLPPSPWSLQVEDQESLGRRLDLRSLRIMSVDPPGCTDIDDALHCRALENGNFEIGVHIADVSHYVRPRTALDDEAMSRGTTVYLVDKRIDMLPAALSTDTCSLRGGVERLAFSCIWEVDADANILATRFHKSIIRSVAALTYEAAQKLIDAAPAGDENAEALRQLNRLAKKLRAARLSRGALTLASTQVRFIRKQDESSDYNHNGAITDVALYETRDTNSMVEEFMLLANISVAEQLLRAYPQFALLRRHPTPVEGAFDSLTQAAAQHGVAINPDSSLSLARSLDGAKSDTNPYFNQLLRILTTRCMTQAVYFCSGTQTSEQFRHYGLAATIYTHFTSPIRRYADVIVHRLLAASIGWEPLPTNVNKARISSIATNINFRARQAQGASRDSTALFTVRFFRGKQVLADAHVTRVKANGFVVLVPRYGIEGVVHLTAKKGDEHHFVYDADHQSLERPASAPLGAARIALFDAVRVCISVDERRPHDVRLQLLCIAPPIGDGATLNTAALQTDLPPVSKKRALSVVSPAPAPAAGISSAGKKRRQAKTAAKRSADVLEEEPSVAPLRVEFVDE
jgi:exosome complex exonuclease DIS3/RRP44